MQQERNRRVRSTDGLGAIMEKQTKPCPECGETAGWWCALDRKSMVFRDEAGCKTEHRIFEKKQKHCAKCDADVTKCVST